MTQSICPHVGAVDADDNRCDPTTYPSFENHCFVVHLIDPNNDGLESRDQLLLRDQATYCLGQSHRLCPRFRLVQSGPNAHRTEDPTEETVLATGIGMGLGLGLGDDFAYDEPSRGPTRLGVWAGIATLMLVFLLCGGSLAAYAGWRLVGQGIATISQRVDTPSTASEPGTVLVLVTATGQPEAQSSVAQQTAAAQPQTTPQPQITPQPGEGPLVIVTELPTPTATFAFPPAVTATPANNGQAGPVVITTPAALDQAVDPLAPALATAVAGSLIITQPDNLPPTPTRRPTPEFVVPTSTPGVPVFSGTPVVAGIGITGTPIDVTPRVSFRAAHEFVTPGECTTISWDVTNARAVFVDGDGVPGRGERRTCPLWSDRIYTLVVLRLDGTEDVHTITVGLVANTAVPTATPTNTPILTPTPTWTPEGTPSATPVPPSYGVRVTVDGGNQKQCTPGQRCQVTLLIENSGSLADEMFVDIGKSGPWSAVICRDDGNCADTSISVGVGPGSQRTVLLAVDVPGDAAGQSYTFQAQAASGNSGRTISSEKVTVTLSAQ